MERNDRFTGERDQAEWESLDPRTREALGNFKSSVDAWSDSMVSRPRTAPEATVRATQRLSAGWILGSIVFVGSVSGGLYQNRHQQAVARVAAAREAEHQRQMTIERAREEEDLLAKVDNDIAREVPSAMEPLASLMADEASK
jgi:hypothetical protein